VHAPAGASIAEHIEAARREAEDHDFAVCVVSLFVGGPKGRKLILDEAQAAELRAYLASAQLRAIAHGSYSDAPWNGDPDAARFILDEARVCAEAGIEGLVIHLSSVPPEQVLRYLGRLLGPGGDGVRIYLETPAVVARNAHYETPEKLAALFRGIRTIDPELRRFGLCVDTAHLWVSGVDLASYAAADDWFRRLEAVADAIPHAAVALHLNDSVRARGVGPDAHAPLAAGKIWSAYAARLGESGLAAVVDYARRHGTPAILERNPREGFLRDYRALAELGG
jgi:endonuclease IV